MVLFQRKKSCFAMTDSTLGVSLLGYQVQTVPQFLYPAQEVVNFYECKANHIVGNLYMSFMTTLAIGNDDKSYQDKSHNEITVQLFAKVA